MYQPRHAGRRRTTSVLAAAGIATLALATAGTLLATSPSHAATPSTRSEAPSITVGSNPIDLAVATFGHRAYVAQDSSVAVVDTTNHQLLTTVPTGLTDQTAITLVQAGAKAYVGSFASGRMAVFDPATNTVTGHVRVGKGTTDIADVVTTTGEFAYLTQYGQHTSRVTVVNARTDQVVGRIHVGGAPVTAVQTPSLKQVWIGTAAAENVKVVNVRTQRVVRTIPMPRSGPVGGIAFNPTGSRAYVTGLGGLTSVKTHGRGTGWFITAPRLFPHGGGINTGPVVVGRHGTLMVVNSTFPDAPQQGTVTVLDRVNRRVLDRISLGTEPTALAADPMGRQLLATNYISGTVSYFAQPR